MPDAVGGIPRRAEHRSPAPVLAVILVLGFLALPPHGLAEKAQLIGYGICHQQGERSYFVGGRQLPLCARDTGTYLGALVTAACMLAGPGRKGTQLPHPVLLALYALGVAFFVVDGLNSYAAAVPLVPQLYAPDNRLRLLSGLAMGSGMAAVLLPLFNYTLWEDAPRERSLRGPASAAVPMGLLAAYLAVTAGPGWLYLPLTVGIAFSVLLVLSAVNGLLVTVILRQDQRGRNGRDALVLLSRGLLLTAAELGVMALARHSAEAALV